MNNLVNLIVLSCVAELLPDNRGVMTARITHVIWLATDRAGGIVFLIRHIDTSIKKQVTQSIKKYISSNHISLPAIYYNL
jgi:hypothetical protein